MFTLINTGRNDRILYDRRHRAIVIPARGSREVDLDDATARRVAGLMEKGDTLRIEGAIDNRTFKEKTGVEDDGKTVVEEKDEEQVELDLFRRDELRSLLSQSDDLAFMELRRRATELLKRDFQRKRDIIAALRSELGETDAVHNADQ